MTDRLTRAVASLLGTAVGDGLGEAVYNAGGVAGDGLPEPPWRWTDDTEMACSVVHVLAIDGHLDPAVLDASFVAHYDQARNYGPGIDAMMRELTRRRTTLAQLATETFGGVGSWGNGAAMRIAPLGAWYHDDPDLAVVEAAAAAVITHTHPEGVAGAVATAVAASVAAAGASPGELMDEVLQRTPTGRVNDGLRDAADLAGVTPAQAAEALGAGRLLSAPDTVPLAVWVAAHHLDDYATAVRTAATVAEDTDTVCAIVGGIVAGRLGESAVPAAWREACEPLPSWVLPG